MPVLSAIPPADDTPWPEGASNVRPLKSPIQPAPFPVTWISDAVLELDARPILKGLIDPGAFVVIYGPSGSGKSFFAADLAQHIATGQQWRGRRVKQGLVVYVASEAGASILKRFVGWRNNRLSESAERIPLAILTRGPNLLNLVEVERLCEQLGELQVASGLPLAMVIFDTLSRSIPGGDENSADDMTMAVNAADYLRERFKCATAYVHHSGKDPAKGARGHSALFAAADLVLGIQDGAATVEKVRDGVGGERFAFALEPIEIGTDCDGDAVMTCLLNVSDDAGQQAPKAKIARGRSSIAISALNEAISEHGQVMPASSTIPKGVRAVTLDQWRDRFTLRYGSDGETPVRQAFYRARGQLLDARLIGISDPYVWAV